MAKCACETLKGKPCKNEAVKLSKFCSVHSRCMIQRAKPAPKGKAVAKKTAKKAKAKTSKKLFTAAEKKQMMAYARMRSAPGYKPKGKIVKRASPAI